MSDLGEVLDALEAERHQLAGLEGAGDPLVRRVEVPLAEAAEVDVHLYGYSLCDVDVGAEAAHAQVGGVGVDGHAALAAQAAGERISMNALYTSCLLEIVNSYIL